MIRRVRALIGEQLTDQPIARHHPVRAEQQQRQQGPLLRSANRHRGVVHPNIQRAQNPELESARHRVFDLSFKHGLRARNPLRHA
jgi:hypothetical protein